MKQLISLLFILQASFCFGKWAEVNTTVSEDLNQILFVGTTGYCVGNNGTLLKSTNSGDSWVTSSTPTSDNILRILFLTSSTGFFLTDAGEVFKTTNGGTSWTGQSLQSGALRGISFADASNGVIVGDNGKIYTTNNGGSSWSENSFESVAVLNSVAFISSTNVIAVGALGAIVTSIDGGENWTWAGVSSNYNFSAVKAKNGSKAMICGVGGNYLTFDFSTNISSSITVIDPEGDWLKDMHTSPSGAIYFVGASRSIVVSTPSFIQAQLDSSNNLNSVYFINDTVGFVCGLGGKIYKTTSAGFGVGYEAPTTYQFSAYPNPTYGLIYLSGVELGTYVNVVNMNGQIVFSAQYEGTINLEQLNTGIYFVHPQNSTPIKIIKK